HAQPERCEITDAAAASLARCRGERADRDSRLAGAAGLRRFGQPGVAPTRSTRGFPGRLPVCAHPFASAHIHPVHPSLTTMPLSTLWQTITNRFRQEFSKLVYAPIPK